MEPLSYDAYLGSVFVASLLAVPGAALLLLEATPPRNPVAISAGFLLSLAIIWLPWLVYLLANISFNIHPPHLPQQPAVESEMK